MEDESNATFITFSGYVEVYRYRFVYFVVMFTVYILIICSNLSIVGLIWIHQNLHEPMYIFIAALLMNSILYCANIYPKVLIDILSEKQIITYQACLVQCFLYYSLSGSELLVLAAMAYDRYLSICKPLQYPTIMRKTTICSVLSLAWIVPACQVAVPVVLSADTKLCNFVLKGIFCNNSAYKLHCMSSRSLSVYGVVVLVNVVFLPMVFILFTYTKIFLITYQKCGAVRRKAAQTCLPHLLVLMNFSCLVTYDVIIVKLESDFPTTVRLIMTLQMILYHPLFNPIIYGLKMKEISKHLKRLFFQHKLQ
ncbi:olfactory receptor 6N2-like [Anabas testudineus]|uniref:Olfactory receptor n=1 Tax=Anabas testudineus TaxID=64144 RepID=A0A7N6BLA4_ANATE|nr:olfactory receptor 6N2-like [Anabas testudineus]